MCARPSVVFRLRDAFDRDRITRRFYDHFKREHAAFLTFIKGIIDQGDREWYASLMLNRLMFVYFIQKKGFLDGDTNYLQNRMRQVREIRGKDKFPNGPYRSCSSWRSWGSRFQFLTSLAL